MRRDEIFLIGFCDESYLFLIEWTVPRIMNNADII